MLISKEQYERIVNQFDFGQMFTQINFYYGEKDNFNSDTTIRVRLKGRNKYLQVKELISTEKGIHRKKEYQKELTSIPDVIEGKILNELCETDKYHDCYLMGQLVTERRVLMVGKCELAIDINYYCGIVDYELEIEFDDEIAKDILQFLKFEEIYREENSRGKFNRFYMRYQELGRN